MRLCSLGSGSAGNSFVVQDNATTLIVDCGCGLNETVIRLDRYGIKPSELNAILVTTINGAFILK